MATEELDLGRYKLGWSDDAEYAITPKKGLTEDVVREISYVKGEPEWMTSFRLRAYKHFVRKPLPRWGGDMTGIDFQDIYYYLKPATPQVDEWDQLPEQMRNTYEKLGIPEAERRYFAGVTSQYDCLRGSTQVWTTQGMRAIKELEPGDEVFAWDERTREIVPARVVGGGCSGVKEVFEISARGRVIGASSNHPFLVLRDERKPGRTRQRFATRWVPVEDLRVGDLVAIATDVPDFGEPHDLLHYSDDASSRLPDATNDDLCWWLGAYLGDGYTKWSGGYASVEIAIDISDDAMVAELIRVGREQLGVEFRVATDRQRLTAHGTRALASFLELNGLGGTAHTKRIPDWVFTLPASQRLSFLAGYTDADEMVRAGGKTKNVVLTSASEQLLDEAKQLAALCGIAGSKVQSFTNKHPKDADRVLVAYRLHLSGRFDRIPLRSGHKAARLNARVFSHSYRSAKGTGFASHTSEMMGFVRIDSIRSVGEELTYDIEVEGRHNFVAEGFVVHNSEVVYHRNREDLESRGILFTDMDTALREHPEIVKKWFGKIIPPADNKLAALNSAVWSGGSFIYIPPGVTCEMPLQAYFRINSQNAGQFERTLIIADEGAQVHYIEGCSAPVYSTDALHSAVVELVALPGSRITYTTIQNWSPNVYNLVTKRARAEAEAHVEWIDGNIGCLAEGSRVTTRGGTKPIELVTPGEEVLSFDDQAGELVWRRVVAKRYSGEQPVREVRTGMRSLRVTDNHPFYSYAYDEQRAKKLGRYQLAYVRADQLAEAVVPAGSIDYGEPKKLRVPEAVTSFETSNQHVAGLTASRSRRGRLGEIETTTDDLMWLFGLYLGDGSVSSAPAASGGFRRAKVTFSVPETDRARERLEQVMATVLPGAEPTRRADGVAVTWNSVELAELLSLNGFLSGALTKDVPTWVVDLPEIQRLAFVAGMLDSDGCAAAGQRGFSIKSVNKKLLEGVADVLTSLGIPARLHTEHDGERPVQILDYQSVSRGSHALVLRADERLVAHVSPRLRAAVEAQAPATLRHHRRVGRSNIVLPEVVEIRKVAVSDPIETVPTWDIEVEGTGNFVSEGFIVHNSKLTMKYPSVVLAGPKASGEVLSVAYAGAGQHQDAGAKMIHLAPETTSTIVSKSIAKDGGTSTYRGLVQIAKGAKNAKSFVRCDALMLDDISTSETKPSMEIAEQDAQLGHEATVSKVGQDQLFYLMSRGLTEQQAMGMIVNGFIEPITRTLPMEYAVEWSRLIELQMEGSIG